MKLKPLSVGLVATGLFTLGLAGCGGGGGSAPSTVVTPAASSLSGTAATGAALAFANVQIKDSAGNSPCVETTITTTGTGSFSCTLKANETAPFFVLVTDPSGLVAPMVSVATDTPAAGAALVVNATPLTTAIVAQAAGTDAVSVFNSGSISASALTTTKTNVLAQLSSVLSAIGAPTGYDPFSTAITAASSSGLGNTADQVLDVVKVTTTSSGALAFTTIDNPNPVPLASATTSGSTVPAPTASVSALASAAQAASSALNGCFALPATQRALTTDTTIASTAGGSAVTSVGSACLNITATSANAGSALPFKHNGYSAGQYFYNLLTDANMNGATFSVPEVVAYYAADSTSTTPLLTHNWAVLNFRYLDANGNPGNVMTVGAQLAGSDPSGTRGTDWWLVGNQHDVDIDLRPQLRRETQYGTAASPSYPSRFQNGLQFRTNPIGPNTNLFDHIYVTGGGLPSTGVWLKKNVVTINSQSVTFFDLLNIRTTTPPSTAPGTNDGLVCNNTLPASYDCNVFWFSATAGLTGTAATTLGTNPGNKRWTQPSDTGAYNGSTGTRPIKGTAYSVRFFNGTSEVTSLAMTKRLNTDVIPATQGVSMPWNSPGSAIANFLSPTGSQNGAISSGTAVSINWTLNTSAPQVSGVNLWTNNGTQYGWDGSVNVARGASAASVTTVFNIDGITSGLTNVHRAVLLGHRTLDGSGRQDVYAAEY